MAGLSSVIRVPLEVLATIGRSWAMISFVVGMSANR